VGRESILATIAGDDTILLITRTHDGGAAIAEQFLQLSAGKAHAGPIPAAAARESDTTELQPTKLKTEPQTREAS
ncbi:MAG TPA: hypothetical protein VEQ66_02165, partial [Propionibacteriaceae bacterium]|nr:hypothetical protein [Propionibacteriaceae bacterium]